MIFSLNPAAPINAGKWAPLDQNQLPYAGLATSLHEEHDYEPRIEGKTPHDLYGTIYHNGPGLFDRGGLRKRMLLDGDGMIQAYDFQDGKVRYRNRFVRTQKYCDEEKGGKFLYATWSTAAPGGPFKNLFTRAMRYQAGVTVCRRDDILYAFDEGGWPYELDPESLETLGVSEMAGLKNETPLWAHWKVDPRTGDLLIFGMNYGRETSTTVAVIDPKGHLKAQRTIPLPRSVYVHDWAISERYFIFLLHPAEISTSSLASFLLGRRSFAEAIQWKPEKGTIVVLAPRDGGDPVQVEGPASWVWHTVNAYDSGQEVTIDFVGGQGITGLGRDAAPFFAVMEGKHPNLDGASSSTMRRYVVNPGKRRLREEVFDPNLSCEFPQINLLLRSTKHRYGYVAKGRPGELFEVLHSGIARVDTDSGDVESYDFGPDKFCLEPVFVPKPGFTYAPGSEHEPGWILAPGYDGETKRSFLAILQADNLAAGPVAMIHLNHHVPISFHGFWHSA